MRVCPRCKTPYTNDTATCPRDGEPLSTLPKILNEVQVPKPVRPGRIVGNYQIQKKLGAGGMGAVYLATHLSIGKEVAIKILLEDSAQNPKTLERFYREARAVAKIDHENIIQISDFGCTPEGLVYIVMELLLGRSLEDLLRTEKKLTAKRAVHIATQICSALSAAHQRKIIHRDLKPENIFLILSRGDPDFVKVLDFGIAKQLDETSSTVSQLMGTPLYMAPESGSALDERADIYALGVILYRMLTGVLPFEGSNVMDILYKHLVEEPRPLREHVDTIPANLEAAVLQALAKRKEDRFPSMEAFARALTLEDEDATKLRRIVAPLLTEDPTRLRTIEDSFQAFSEEPAHDPHKTSLEIPAPVSQEESTDELSEGPRTKQSSPSIPVDTGQIELEAPLLPPEMKTRTPLKPNQNKEAFQTKQASTPSVVPGPLAASRVTPLPVTPIPGPPARTATPPKMIDSEATFEMRPTAPPKIPSFMPEVELPAPLKESERPTETKSQTLGVVPPPDVTPEVIELPKDLTPANGVSAPSISGELASPPVRNTRQRLLIGLTGFLLLWGVGVVVLMFSSQNPRTEPLKASTISEALPKAPKESPSLPSSNAIETCESCQGEACQKLGCATPASTQAAITCETCEGEACAGLGCETPPGDEASEKQNKDNKKQNKNNKQNKDNKNNKDKPPPNEKDPLD